LISVFWGVFCMDFLGFFWIFLDFLWSVPEYLRRAIRHSGAAALPPAWLLSRLGGRMGERQKKFKFFLKFGSFFFTFL